MVNNDDATHLLPDEESAKCKYRVAQKDNRVKKLMVDSEECNRQSQGQSQDQHQRKGTALGRSAPSLTRGL